MSSNPPAFSASTPVPSRAYTTSRFLCIWGGPLVFLLILLLGAIGVTGVGVVKFVVLASAVYHVQRWLKDSPGDRVAAVARRTGFWHLGVMVAGEVLGVLVFLATSSMTALAVLLLLQLVALVGISVYGHMGSKDALEDL
ncbi:hypothetical protein D3C71_25860 [compost metagenome]